MAKKKLNKWTRRRVENNTLRDPSKVSISGSRKKSQRNSGKKLSVTHQKIFAVTRTKRHFVDLRLCMEDFASNIILKNEKRHVKILRIYVEWHWESEVLKYFEDDSDWMHEFLLDQKHSPSMAASWTKREDEKAYDEKKGEQLRGPGFRSAGRGLSAAEKKGFPWATIMRDGDGKLLVPDVFLAPIHKTNIVDFALKVLVANPYEVVDQDRMMDLFSAIITKIYIFEHEPEKSSKLAQAAAVNPSAYQKILQVAETMKQERRKCKRSEANESSYESESSLDMTDKVEAVTTRGRGRGASESKPRKVVKPSGRPTASQAVIAPGARAEINYAPDISTSGRRSLETKTTLAREPLSPPASDQHGPFISKD